MNSRQRFKNMKVVSIEIDPKNPAQLKELRKHYQVIRSDGKTLTCYAFA